MNNNRNNLFPALAFVAFAAGCSGGGGGASSNVATSPPPPPPPTDQWTQVRTDFNNSSITDMTLEVGDDTGTLLVVQKGTAVAHDTTVVLDSVTKWVSGAVIMTMYEQGKLSLSDTPETYITSWTSDSSDPRSQMTLAQLLNFTAGFPWTPSDSLSHITDPEGCFYNGLLTFDECLQDYYGASASVLQTPVGSTYTYGAGPLQTAGAMAIFQKFGNDTGGAQSWDTLFHQQVADPMGLTNLHYNQDQQGSNVPIADGLDMSADQMAVFSQTALTGTSPLTGQPVPNFLQALEDMDYDAWDKSTPQILLGAGNGVANVFYSPIQSSIQEPWHYGRAVWLACHSSVWTPTSDPGNCAAHHSVYAAGAQGFTTWINRDHNYWAVLSMQQTLDDSGVVATALTLAEQLETDIATAHPGPTPAQ